ncbi:hypothetical protein ACFHW2_42585 [Actinomadura sp. LOL_016]|uniref:hypothetical protein n=1 Tax=unclassified Actinomadura TaxID=2626254 RepID=UPI003A800165
MKTAESLTADLAEQEVPAQAKYMEVEFKIKNVDTMLGDTTTAAKWVGADGEVEPPAPEQLSTARSWAWPTP